MLVTVFCEVFIFRLAYQKLSMLGVISLELNSVNESFKTVLIKKMIICIDNKLKENYIRFFNSIKNFEKKKQLISSNCQTDMVKFTDPKTGFHSLTRIFASKKKCSKILFLKNIHILSKELELKKTIELKKQETLINEEIVNNKTRIISQKENTLKEMYNEVETINEQLETLKVKYDFYQKQLQQKDLELVKKQKEYETSLEEKEFNKKKLLSKIKELESVTKKINTIEDSFNSQLLKLKNTYREKIEYRENEWKQLKSKFEKLEQEKDKTDSVVSEQKLKLDYYQKSLDDKNQSISQITMCQEKSDEKMEVIEKSVMTLNTENENLKEENDSLKNNLENNMEMLDKSGKFIFTSFTNQQT